MKVVMVEPNKPAYITEIGDDYKSIHDAVGGLIEPIYFLHERGVVMVGNEEAKLLGMEGNRRFNDGIVAGPFFICGDNIIMEFLKEFKHVIAVYCSTISFCNSDRCF